MHDPAVLDLQSRAIEYYGGGITSRRQLSGEALCQRRLKTDPLASPNAEVKLTPWAPGYAAAVFLAIAPALRLSFSR